MYQTLARRCSPSFARCPDWDDDSTEFGDVIGDEEAQTPFELLRDKNLRSEVDGLIEMLDSREKKIISQRFGLDGGEPKTLEDVSKNFGLTRERIRQLQNTPRDVRTRKRSPKGGGPDHSCISVSFEKTRRGLGNVQRIVYFPRKRSSSAIGMRMCRIARFGLISPRLINLRSVISEIPPRY